MDPSYLLPVFLAGVSSLMVLGDIFFAHLGPFSTNRHSLKAIAYLSIVDEYAHPFMTNAYPSSDYFFQLDKASCHRAQMIPFKSSWRFVSQMCSLQICSQLHDAIISDPREKDKRVAASAT